MRKFFIMKKNIYLMLVFLTFVSLAQKSRKDEGIIMGIKGGLNVSNFMGDIDDQSIRTSVHLGLVSEIVVSDKFSLQPELLYSGQGSSDGSVQGFSRYKLSYLTLPIMGKFAVTEGLSFQAGPQIGFLLSAKNKTDTSNDKIKDIKTLDFGICAGLEYDFSSRYFIQGRYNLGLSDTGISGDSNKRVANSVFQISIGYLF